MLTVALTGGIASGKSVVTEVLHNLGCYIHQSDQAAHELIQPGTPAWQKIKDHFGPSILNSDKTINRKSLGRLVFENPEERSFMNNLLHPLVMEKKKELINRLRAEGRYKIFISEAALTIESGYASFFDKIVVVYCPREIQLKRLIERNHLSLEMAQKKLQSQMAPEKKLPFADYIINTSGSIASTIEQSERLFRHLMMDYFILYK
ncbi:MAG: dephospho-CoA kinase [Acidobacteriota bacterium]